MLERLQSLKPDWVGVSQANGQEVVVSIYADLSYEDVPVCDAIVAYVNVVDPIYVIRRIHKRNYKPLEYRRLYKEMRRKYDSKENFTIDNNIGYFDIIQCLDTAESSSTNSE